MIGKKAACREGLAVDLGRNFIQNAKGLPGLPLCAGHVPG